MGDGERLSSELLSHEALVQKGWELQKKGLHTPQMDGAGCLCSPYTLGAVCVFRLLATIVGVGVPLLPSSSALVCLPAPPHLILGLLFCSAPRVLGLVTWAWEMAQNSNCTWGVGGLGGRMGTCWIADPGFSVWVSHTGRG